MYRLFTLSTLILVSVCTPKRPRIYNVLISTKKNLSPSHAIPVYEPVIRTTSVGVAFPPLIYHTPLQQPNTPSIQPLTVLNGGPVIQEIIKTPATQQQIHDEPSNVQKLPIEQYIQYNRYTSPYFQQYLNKQEVISPDISNHRYKEEQTSNLGEISEPQRNFGKYYENVNDPKQIIANFKKNPEIPDVPPPELPVKNL
ncbi:uncharacterized protein LOC109608352 isoform X2 [Aethina tumida]|nr:uncharacterized protein LOC109608352 isoform X2 [Aethina tumida]XP_049826844.1 uncharacterized protein LOC109608352 isoform X2 [Aethina tumida]